MTGRAWEGVRAEEWPGTASPGQEDAFQLGKVWAVCRWLVWDNCIGVGWGQAAGGKVGELKETRDPVHQAKERLAGLGKPLKH